LWPQRQATSCETTGHGGGERRKLRDNSHAKSETSTRAQTAQRSGAKVIFDHTEAALQLGPALLDSTKPILHVASALRIERYNGRQSVRLQIDDAASTAGSVSAH
jgi:hypothetical protein